MMPKLSPITVFFIGSGIAQIFWILPMIKRWGKPWYYIGIAGNVGFIILYIITRSWQSCYWKRWCGCNRYGM